ncbi:hypothetical protein [Roseimarinus sediminis]|uniref:hypothetical protein n=1 Tax=Roseimarinus sediminis TaxID=1610899 RepID=UPI003D1FC106
MISIDQLEILLRSVPQYLLFGALSLYIFGWIEKKSRYIAIAEGILGLSGISALIVLMSGMIPSPLSEGIESKHIEMVIKMLTILSLSGFLALVSLLVRLIKKASPKPLVLIAFLLALFVFFSSTRLSRIKFELNVPAVVSDSIE